MYGSPLSALAVLFAMLVPAHAAELRVSMIQFDPWAQEIPHGKGVRQVGIVVDLLDAFEQRSPHRFLRTLTPYARVEKNLQDGLCDFALMAWGPARAAYANRGTTFLPLEFGVRFRKGVTAKHYDELYAFTLSAPRGLKVDPRFDSDPRMRRDMVMDYTEGVRKLAAGRQTDGVAGSLSTINYLIEKYAVHEHFGDTLVLNVTELAVAWSHRSARPELEAEVNAVFRSMVEDGSAEKIYQKWLGKHGPSNLAHPKNPGEPER